MPSCPARRLHCAVSAGVGDNGVCNGRDGETACVAPLVQLPPMPASPPPQGLTWSSDDVFLALRCTERAVVQVLCPGQPAWTASVDEGDAGLAGAVWVPHQHTLLALAEFSLHTSVWHLHSGRSCALPGAKALPAGVAFASAAGTHWAALLAREGGQDSLHWFDSSGTVEAAPDADTALWTPVGGAIALGTRDAAAVLLAANGSVAWVVDDALATYAEAWSPSGERLAVLKPDVPGLGVIARTAAVSASGGLLLLPTHAGPLLVYNALSYEQLASVHPAGQGALAPEHTSVFVEVPADAPRRGVQALEGGGDEPLPLAKWRARLGESRGEPTLLLAGRPILPEALGASAVHDTSPPQLGALRVAGVSACERFVAAVCASSPATLHVYGAASGKDAAPLATLCLRAPVTGAVWDGTAPRLVVATACATLFVWEPAGAYCVGISLGAAGARPVVRSLATDDDGAGVWLLASRSKWCVGHALAGSAVAGDAAQ